MASIVVVNDYGHGGRDTSAYAYHNGLKFRMWEPEYAYDIGLRAKLELEQAGAMVVETVHDSTHVRPIDKSILRKDKHERFTLTGMVVNKSTDGLMTRVRTANAVLDANPGKQVLYISYHIDHNVPRRKRIEPWHGAYVIVPRYGPVPEIAYFIVDELRAVGRLRVHPTLEPIVRSGQGVSYVRFLRGEEDAPGPEWNRVEQRVLIEFGNLAAHQDRTCLADFNCRQLYGQVIARAVTKYAEYLQQRTFVPFWIAYQNGASWLKPGSVTRASSFL